VTPPLYLLDPWPRTLAPGDRVQLTGDEGRHAATVRRSRAGERIDVADGLGRRARCVVSSAGTHQLQLEVIEVLDDPAPDPALVLVQALAKGGRDEQAVESATELDVDEVLPWQARRSVVIWSGERGRRSLQKWRTVVRAAAKQARRSRVPHVGEVLDGAALARVAGDVVASGGLVLVLHEAAQQPLTEVPVDRCTGRCLVVVGPEGGVEDGELAALVAVGALPVRLGGTVLRSSSAGPAALAVLNARLGRWAGRGDGAQAPVSVLPDTLPE